MGFRPTTTGFELRKGVFYNFCKKAEIDSDNEYFFIIDEINRGNLSKIFGELFMLIENDKRGKSIQLLYSEEKFSIPENVYIIGMMNTADRSLALLDYALRRRFSFIDMKPGFKTECFAEYQSSLDCKRFDKLVDCVERLNRVISEDDTLGEGFCIGHSYFCNLDPDTVTENTLNEIVKYELFQLLKEYWFDEPSNVQKMVGRAGRGNTIVIPIQNIYYMLAYAFQILREQGYRSIATESFHNTADLMAEILIRGTSVQIKRGLGRQYVTQTEELSTLRGKIDIAQSVKKQTMRNKKLICSYDEFSVNENMNQVIKSTLIFAFKSRY